MNAMNARNIVFTRKESYTVRPYIFFAQGSFNLFTFLYQTT